MPNGRQRSISVIIFDTRKILQNLANLEDIEILCNFSWEIKILNRKLKGERNWVSEIRKKTMKIEYEERVLKLDKITTQYRNIVENTEGKNGPM